MTLASFPELQKLPKHQKLKLADELWQAGISDKTPLTPAQKRLVDRRWASYRSGRSARISLAELSRRTGKR